MPISTKLISLTRIKGMGSPAEEKVAQCRIFDGQARLL